MRMRDGGWVDEGVVVSVVVVKIRMCVPKVERMVVG